MSNKAINEGGSAFPLNTSFSPNGAWNPPFSVGMTLRDWFAGMALQGMLANTSVDRLEPDEYASDAYLYADAMIVRRKKP